MTLHKRIQLLALTGLLFMIAGVFLYLDFMNVATKLNMGTDNQNKLLGAVMFFVGCIDLFVLPAILLKQKPK